MKLLKIDSIEELKAEGKFSIVKNNLQNYLGMGIKLKARGWKNLMDIVESLKNVVYSEYSDYSNKNYFCSKQAEIIFYLLELDGEVRKKKLKINKSHFQEKNKADKWKKEMQFLLHPDICNHSKANDASNKVTELYIEMIRNV